MSDSVQLNIEAHDRGAATYERRHGEIFNTVEQERLRLQLADVVAAIDSSRQPPQALDFGCGSGNMTGHLLAHGCYVIAADVSAQLLHLVENRFLSTGRCRTMLLRGTSGELPRNTYDIVCAYSVLHHLPNYLETVRELVRSLRPGGLLVLDHEASPASWQQSALLDSWHREGRRRLPWAKEWLRSVATWDWIAYRFRRLRDSRATLEGDLHVWPDDHIRWDLVELAVREEGAEPWKTVDYLLFRRHYRPEVYERYRSRAADIRCFIARKTREP